MKINKFYPLILLFTVLCAVSSFAQEGRLPTKQELEIKSNLEKVYKNLAGRSPSANNHLMVTGPEQNCNNAIPVCQQTYTQNSSYTGHGTIQEVSGTCLSTQETNSVWYTFTVQNSGTFTFMLNTANDYDFALYDITTIGCAGVPTATPIRCNFSATYGSTGLTLPPGSNAPNGIPASGVPTMPGLNVTAGQTFALIIDNYSANSNGYTLTFGGTASIFDQTPPAISSIVAPCSVGSITVNLSEPIRCNSIAADGSDFNITGPGGIIIPITAAVGNCNGGAGFTNQLTITYNNSVMPTGTYTLSTLTGSDANTILDNCGNTMLVGLTQTFNHLGNLSISTPNAAICAGDNATITVTGGTTGATYSWSPQSSSDSFIVVTPIVNTTYNASVTYGSCSANVSQAISITIPPIVSVTPSNVSLCSGTTTISASAFIGSTLCSNCNFTWSGGSSQVDLNTSTSVLTGVGAGNYSVTVSSGSGCNGNTASSTVSILSPVSLPSCDILYVSPTGTGNGASPTTPTTIQNALTLAACNNAVIKMQIGDYTINSPLSVGSFVTIEGGYNTSFTQKTSAKATSGGFPLQGTRILRTTSNPEGVAGNLRLTALNVTAGSSYFRLQDLRIDMPDNAAGTAISNYGVYLGSGCTDYKIVRCYIYSGNAGSGIAGAPATGTSLNGTPGRPGGVGGNGNNVSNSGGTFGDGGAEASGAGSTHSPMYWNFTGGASNGTTLIAAEAANGGIRSGGEGGAGGSGGYYAEDGGNGSPGGAGGGGALGGTVPANSGGWYDCGWTSSMDGFNGNAGANGANGAVGTTGPAGSDASGYWVPGGAGGAGGDGAGGGGGGGAGGGGGDGDGFFCFNTTGTGGGGGGGGGGGQGGQGGQGGTGGGSTFGIFIFNGGANGNVVDCQIINGTAGAGGLGGAGTAGGTGGAGGARGCADACTGSGEGNGGTGGAGGAGGAGGQGGSGSAGTAIAVRTVGGTALVTNTSLVMLAQPVITVDNIACVGVNISHETTAATPVWSSYGLDASPASGTGTPSVTTYTTTGRKTVVMNGNTYTDFNNIITNQPSAGNILASATQICPGTATFNATAAGTPGFTFAWSVSPSSGVSISDNDSTVTSVTFPNATASPITYTVTLQVATLCCGNLVPITQTITVNPIPANPTINDTTICTGGTATLTATAPVGASFDWYSVPSGGTAVSSGTTFTISPVSSNQTYYIESISSNGCGGARIPVNITVNPVAAPTAIDVTECEPGTVQVGASPVSGATIYNWYSDASGTTLLQSGPSLVFGVDVLTQGGSVTVYVSDSIPGCDRSALVPVVASVSNNPILADTVYSTNDTVCAGANVTITVNATGGSGSYTYLWSPNGETTNSINISPATNSTAYSVIVSDGTCSKLVSTPLIVGSGATPPSVLGATTVCTGDSIYLYTNAVTGGVYTWTGPAGTTITTHDTVAVVYPAVVANSGTYNVSLDNGSGCPTNSTPYAITVNSLPVVSANNVTICSGNTASITASGATSYTWSAGVTSTGINTATASPTSTTTYTLVGTESSTGCSNDSTFTVTVNNLPIISASDASVCLGGTATLTVSGADTYVWSTTATTNTISVTPASVGSSTYTVVGTNTLTTCSSAAYTVTVTANSLPNVTATAANSSICSGASTVLTANGATSYVWSTSATTNTVTVSPTSTTTYSVTGTDNGCASTTTVTVTVTQSPQIGNATPVNATCNLNNGSVSPSVTGGTPGYTYNWVSLLGSTSVGSSASLTNVGIGSYQLTVTDANGCVTTSNAFNVGDGGSVNAQFVTSVNSGVVPLSVGFTNSSTGANNYAWNFGNGQVSALQNPGPVTYNTAGNYTVTLVVTNGTCFDTASVLIMAEIPSSIIIPNIFSPNGDQVNDVFTIVTTGMKTLDVDIFNRWGQKVAIISGVGQSWDGKLNNGDNASEGTYFYMLKAVGIDGTVYEKQGSMMLVK